MSLYQLVSPQEIETTITYIPCNRSPGVDNILNETIKACNKIIVIWLKIVFTFGKNKGNKRECESYRGTSLVNHTAKIYAKILEQRARYIIYPQLGFKKGASYTYTLLPLRQIRKKAIEYNKYIIILFITPPTPPPKEAFVRVKRNILWETL
jgi:hypothetical protein